MMDRKLAAQKIRTRFEYRLAGILACEPHELPRLKIGSLVHTLFLLEGAQQTIGGFDTTMHAILDLLGHEIVWDMPREEEKAGSSFGSWGINLPRNAEAKMELRRLFARSRLTNTSRCNASKVESRRSISATMRSCS